MLELLLIDLPRACRCSHREGAPAHRHGFGLDAGRELVEGLAQRAGRSDELMNSFFERGDQLPVTLKRAGCREVTGSRRIGIRETQAFSVMASARALTSALPGRGDTLLLYHISGSCLRGGRIARRVGNEVALQSAALGWRQVPVRRGYPASMPLTSARQVMGPTMPSTATEGTSSESACWNPRTASSVRCPKIPST